MSRLSLVMVGRDVSQVVGHRLLIMVASLVAEHGLLSAVSVVVVHGFSCPVACGIFLDQESNLCPLHYQVDS